MNKKTCKLCNSPVVDIDNNLCRKHHTQLKYEQWLDNSDKDNLGIVKWIEELMPNFATSAIPQMHKDLYYDLLSLYNPEYTNKYERLYEFICFREGAKSTAANTLFTSYLLANNGKKIKFTVNGEVKEFLIEERTIIIISQTSGSAEEFTVRIRDNFSNNKRLHYYYPLQITQAIDTSTNQWTRSAFQINGCFVQGIGSGQQIRGKVKGVSRPTLVIADDIYSEGTIVTEEARAKTRAWWNNAVMNSIDNVIGKVVMLGTILHDDTVLVDAKNNPQWTTFEKPLMDIDKFHEFIDAYIEVDWDTGTCVLPYADEEIKNVRFAKQKDFFREVQKKQDWKLSWPERIDLYFIAIKYQEAVYNRTVSGMYQEYFHITKSPFDKSFRSEFFLKLKNYEYKYENNHNWIKLYNEDKWEVLNIEFGIDLAGGGADDAVITVVGTMLNGKIIVLHQAFGRWSLRDDLKNGNEMRYYSVVTDRSLIKKIGITDEAYRLALKYHPSRIKVGVAGEEKTFVNEMRKVFRINKKYEIQIIERPQTKHQGSKEERIMNTVLPFYETRMVYHTPNLQKLEYQLEYLGASDHDDCADSLECAIWNITYPTSNLDYENYTEEFDINKDKNIELDDDWWVYT